MTIAATDDQRFYWQDLDSAPNVADLMLNVAATLDPQMMAAHIPPDYPLYGIVDDEAGGIIGYAIGQENAAQIVAALERGTE